MTGLSTRMYRSRAPRSLALGLFLAVGAGCGEDGVSPSETAAFPADSTITTAAPSPGDGTPPTADSTLTPPVDSSDYSGAGAAGLDTRSRLPGILFGSFSMASSYLNNVHTGWMQGGAISPQNVLQQLAEARAKGGRVVMKLSMGHDRYVQNGDRTFSVTKWKSLVDRFKSVNLRPYIEDGTIVGHYLVDEPHRTARWGGKIISQATLEDMAKHSKRIWPDMTTFVRVVPSWLASAPITYVHLDAGWTQYAVGKGSAAAWVASETAAARRKGLGLAVGLNVLDGGNGSSRIPGYTKGKWAMSASELRSYGTAMLNESHACAFFMWTHNLTYYGRSDIKSAMAEVSAKAKSHAKTSCRQ